MSRGTSGARRPPRLACWILERCLPEGVVGSSIRSDLRREYEELCAAAPGRPWRWWYRRQVLSIVVRYVARRPIERLSGRAARDPRRGRSARRLRRHHGGSRMEEVLRDVRFGARVLAANRGFTAVAIATLALGVGANTAVFSVLNAVLLRPLGFERPEQLVSIRHRALDGTLEGGNTAPAIFYDWRERSRSFSAMAVYSTTASALRGDDYTRRVVGVVSAGSVLEVLGARPLFGRVLTDEDDRTGARVMVLSHDLWRSLYGGDRGILGSDLLLDGVAHEIVGVLPPEFEFLESVQYWAPSGWSAEYRANRSNFAHRVVARLRSAVSVVEANDDLRAVSAQLRREYPEVHQNLEAHAVPLRDELTLGVERQLLFVPMGAVALVLLIACVNLANLLMAQGTAREPELAVRRALGAGRARLVRQVLTESLLLAMAGGGAGLVVGVFLIDAVLGLLPADLPIAGDVTLDVRVLAFTLSVSLVAGVAFGLLPALGSGRASLGTAMGAASRASARSSGAWTGLVVAEVALSVILLFGAGLLVRTFANLAAVDAGFPIERLMTFRVAVPPRDGADNVGFWRRLVDETRTIPRVVSASAVSRLPAETRGVTGWFNYADHPVDNSARSWLIPYRVVLPGYFETLGIPLVRGRYLRQEDGTGTPGAVINETAWRRLWPDSEPIGDRLTLGGRDGAPWFPPLTVVGVVADVRNVGIDRPPAPTVFVPHDVASGWSSLAVVMRVDGDFGRVLPMARERLARLDPGAPMYAESAIEDMYRQQLAPTRSMMALLVTFAALGLTMAGVGVFGVLSYSVGRRRRELGIRIALGASGGRMMAMVVGQAMARVVPGAALGIVGALAASRVLSGVLYGVSPADPLTLGGVAGVLTAVALLASWMPARRAARVDPADALRAE